MTVYVLKNGVSSLGTGTVTQPDTAHQAGVYLYTPSAGDVNTLGELDFNATSTNATYDIRTRQVVAFDPNDAAALGLTRLDANISSRSTYAGADTPGTTVLRGLVNGGGTAFTVAALANAPTSGTPQTGDVFSLLNPLISAGKFTAPALSLAPAGTGGGSVTVAGYAAGQDPASLLLLTPANKLATDASGKVGLQPAEYANIASGVFASALITIPGSHTSNGSPLVLTSKQKQALEASWLYGDNTSTVPVASGTATVTYYLVGQPKVTANVVDVATLTYDAGKNQIGRSDVIAAPFPTF